MRTFVAVPLHPEVVTAYGRWLEQCRSQASQLKWVEPALLHVTIRFLGELDASQVAKVKEAVRKAASHTRPFPLQVAGRGVFPDPRHPRVFWFAVEPRTALLQLAEEVDEQLAQAGWLPRQEPFRAHLTVARARPGQFVPTTFVGPWLGSSSGTLAEQDGFQLPGFEAVSPCAELVVMESRLRPGGPLYLPQARYPLGR
ncbi:MAG: RNA 2',3'-cyclic phosphodiesterase [Limnochordaceae bacterium]|nr:RNA 2',3'-cyclic phosphodiesterase [Limnochordaceae bacterium]